MTAIRLPIVLLCALALAGCGDKPATDSTVAGPDVTPGPPSADAAAAVAETVPPLPELGDFRIAGLLLGTTLDADDLVEGDRETFAPGDYELRLAINGHPIQGRKFQVQ